MSGDGESESRRSSKSSGLTALMTVNYTLPNIPIINEPSPFVIATANDTNKKKALRFDTNTLTTEYSLDSDEIRENKKKIKDEIKK